MYIHTNAHIFNEVCRIRIVWKDKTAVGAALNCGSNDVPGYLNLSTK